jgi:hypothetical protein
MTSCTCQTGNQSFPGNLLSGCTCELSCELSG